MNIEKFRLFFLGLGLVLLIYPPLEASTIPGLFNFPTAPVPPPLPSVITGGSGTGFIVHPDGYILTNRHVIDGARSITVPIGNSSYEATVLGTVDGKDIALLKINATGFPVVMLGDSDGVDFNDEVYAHGCPKRICGTFTEGKVANIGITNQQFLMLDITWAPGSSGGPLLNTKGEVIGLTTATLRKDQNSATEFRFAVPINQAIELLQRIPGFSVSQMGQATEILTPSQIRTRTAPATVFVDTRRQVALNLLPKELLGMELVDVKKDVASPDTNYMPPLQFPIQVMLGNEWAPACYGFGNRYLDLDDQKGCDSREATKHISFESRLYISTTVIQLKDKAQTANAISKLLKFHDAQLGFAFVTTLDEGQLESDSLTASYSIAYVNSRYKSSVVAMDGLIGRVAWALGDLVFVNEVVWIVQDNYAHKFDYAGKHICQPGGVLGLECKKQYEVNLPQLKDWMMSATNDTLAAAITELNSL